VVVGKVVPGFKVTGTFTKSKRRTIENDALARIRKKTVVAFFKTVIIFYPEDERNCCLQSIRK
jgi:hypothetical protein